MNLTGSKLTYFGIPGRGESIRLALTIGKVPFVDERIPFPQWPDLKPQTPWGGLPYLTLTDGTVLAQQRSILRFVGKETDLYPTGGDGDSLLTAKVDELLDAVEDVAATVMKAGAGLPKEEKEAARLAAVSEGGSVHAHLSKIDAFLKKNSTGGGYAVGDKMTIADLFVYTNCSNLVSGLFDGVPSNAIDGFANIQACRKAVRSHPLVMKYYSETDAKMPAAYGALG